MPDEQSGYGELRQPTVPPSLEDSRTDQTNQRDHLSGHENTEQDASELEVRESRQQPPTNGIEHEHGADNGENESHMENVSTPARLSGESSDGSTQETQRPREFAGLTPKSAFAILDFHEARRFACNPVLGDREYFRGHVAAFCGWNDLEI